MVYTDLGELRIVPTHADGHAVVEVVVVRDEEGLKEELKEVVIARGFSRRNAARFMERLKHSLAGGRLTQH